LIYLKNINVKIVKHNPIEDNNNPINVIIERICSTNLGVGFCSISFKIKIKQFLSNKQNLIVLQTIKTAKCVK
jgi:hypothetical protein